MYLDYFSLKEKPFSITPDPAYLFLSKRHAEALAHLVYGVTDSGGFIQLTGEVGTGKTTIVRSLLEQLPGNVDVALVLNPRLTVNEFLQTICDELRIKIDKNASNKECIDQLNKYLLHAYGEDRRVVLLIDEAQNLSVEVLEQIRLLTNLETHKDKLLQIILVGQPELQALLQRQDLRQLAQRITARYHLRPLSRQESHDYISHRLTVAGGKPSLISGQAKTTIFNAAKGIPRLMNVIAERALLGAYSQEKPQVNLAIAKQAIREVAGDERIFLSGNKSSYKFQPKLVILGTLSALVISSVAAYKLLNVTESATINSQADASQLSGQSTHSKASVLTNAESKNIVKRPKDNSVDVPHSKEKNIDAKLNVQSQLNSRKHVQLDSLLQKNYTLTTSEHAFNQLLSVWNKSEFQSHQDACNNLLAQGLSCYFTQRQTLESVFKLNRPVILELKGLDNQLHQITVVKINEAKFYHSNRTQWP